MGFQKFIDSIRHYEIVPIYNPGSSLRSVCGARSGVVPSTCNVSTGLRFFKICQSAELNKIVEATMPMNLYDDSRVSLPWRHRKGDLDIVNSTEGKCN